MSWNDDEYEGPMATETPDYPKENMDELSEHLAVHQQRFDAEALKRFMVLQRNIAEHVNQLRQSVQDIAQAVSDVNLSAFALHVGAMPEWYEDATKNADSNLSSGLATMEYIADRLAEDYLA